MLLSGLAETVIEGLALAREARRRGLGTPRRRELGGKWLLFERLLEHPLHPGDIEQIHGERPLAGSVEPGRAVPFSQPQQALALAKLRPGKIASEESFGEQPDERAELGSSAHHVIWSAQ